MRNDDYDFVANALFVEGFLGIFYELAVALTPIIITGLACLFKTIKSAIEAKKEKKIKEQAKVLKEAYHND